MSLILRYAVRSDLGLVRTNNEDSVYAGPRLLAIADGMGGHAAGEVASKIVISTLEPLDEDRSFTDLAGSLRETVLQANGRIAAAVEQRSELEGMGTTLTALRFVGDQVGLVHVGDSRAYLLRDDLLAQITHDDTYVQYLVDEGRLTPDEAKEHPRKSVILRALLGTDVDPDVSLREARDGDRYLLCTDGLTDVVSAETLAETLRIPDPQEAADRLVDLALRGGGPDNVTVIVADVREAGPGDFADDVPVIAGAFVDPNAEDVPGEDSPAARAARITRPPVPPVRAVGRSRRGPKRRTVLWVVAVLIVIFGGLGGTYAITQTYYFVGRSGNQVAIYRGINTQIGPFKFFSVYRKTGPLMESLNPVTRSDVTAGITAHNRGDAQRIVQNLQTQLLPPCVTATPSPTVTPAPTPTHTSALSKTAGTKPTATRSSTRSAARPTGTAVSPPASPPVSPAPSLTQTPGVDCRTDS